MSSGRPHVGLIGFGAIGADVFARLAPAMCATVVLRAGSASRSAVPPGAGLVATLGELLAARPHLVVEAAGQAALAEAAPAVLAAGLPLVAASTGALGDAVLLERLVGIAAAHGGRLIVPGGALGGLDYLVAARGAGGLAVRYTSRKPPAAWTAELAALGLDPTALTGETVLFEGAPAEAARLYPRNVNAGLTVALAAGAGVTRVRVVADPAASLNTHEIEVESALGSAFLRFANRPAPSNPKTSALTAASIAAAVRRHFEPLVI